ncbi:MAG: ATP-binding cassette domain-containing protein [bacterium]
MESMIELKNVSKHYKAIKAVDDVSFSVECGEVLGFLGPNGAGKTTVMKMITGYMPPDNGEIHVKGRRVSSNMLEVRRLLGYLPETNPIYLDMTVWEYMDFIAEMRDLKNKSEQIEKTLEKCGIKDVKHRIIGDLSKGYKQRAGLAQAILHDPEILILDEPMEGLDPRQITEIRSLIKTIGREKTVIFCSHILSEVEAVADRVIIINKGKIIADDDIKGLKQRSAAQNIVKMEFFKAVAEDQASEKISALPTVTTVEKEDEKNYRIVSSENVKIGNELYNLARNENWEISQIYVESSSLENMFLDITQGGGL